MIGISNKKSNKGSITVEACIVFPIFLCVFLLLIFFIKVACINIVLDKAANETAKQIAASYYPVTLLDELEDELIGDNLDKSFPTLEEERKNISSYISEDVKDNAFEGILAGGINKEAVIKIIEDVAGNILSDYGDGIRGYIVNLSAGKYYEIKSMAKYAAVNALIGKFCDNALIDKDKLRFFIVELPQGAAEYRVKSSRPSTIEEYKALGIQNMADNVVIALEYRITVPIPFFKDREIVTRHVAVEKAWLKGENGKGGSLGNNSTLDSGSNSKENTGSNEIYYITRTGEKYHKEGCMYLSKSKIPISKEDAEERGYTPCKVCVLNTAKDWRKN